MSDSLLLQASFGPEMLNWHSIDWANCHRRVRSLQRRIVQAVKTGHWRKAKRLYYLLVNSFDAHALGVKRVTENKGEENPWCGRHTLGYPGAKSRSGTTPCPHSRVPAKTAKT